jgi:hypothetical protein
MGPERDAEDPHQGSGAKPKLSLAGRLDGYVDGWPVSLFAENRDLTLIAGKFRALLALRRSWRTGFRPLSELLQAADIRVLLRLWWFGKMEVFPRSNFLLRLILPRI